MKTRLHLMQLLREEKPEELLNEACQPKLDEIDRNMQAVAQAAVQKQVEIQHRISSAVAAEAAPPPEEPAKEILEHLQERVEVISQVDRELEAVTLEEQRRLEETGQNVARLRKDLIDLRTALEGIKAGSPYERLAIDVSQKLMGRRLEHWHPGAPRPPKKEK